MTNDTPRTTVSRYGKDWDDKMDALVKEHNSGQHGPKNKPLGCPEACPGWLLTQIKP